MYVAFAYVSPLQILFLATQLRRNKQYFHTTHWSVVSCVRTRDPAEV